jgi:hypothetical protein
MNDPSPMKPEFNHLQISLRLPHWVVTRIDGIAAVEYTNRASVLRRLLAGAVRGLPSQAGYSDFSESPLRDHPNPTESHPSPTPLLHHLHCPQA